MRNAACTGCNPDRCRRWMRGWRNSAASGRRTSMPSNATLTAWTVTAWTGEPRTKRKHQPGKPGGEAAHKKIRRRDDMKIKVTSVYVDDQDKALRFYTEVLGFTKKTDFSQGPYRWLTVASPEEPNGTELQLALNSNPDAKAYQQAIFRQKQPAAMFFTDDVRGDYERIKG